MRGLPFTPSTIVRLRGIVTVDVRCACAVPHHLTWPQYRTLQDGYLWVLSITQYRTLQDGYEWVLSITQYRTLQDGYEWRTLYNLVLAANTE